MASEAITKKGSNVKEERPFRFHVFKNENGEWDSSGGLKALLENYTKEQLESMVIFDDGHYVLEFTAGFDENGALVYVKTPSPPAPTT